MHSDKTYWLSEGNHACNMPGCACGVMAELESERALERQLGMRLPRRQPDAPGPLSRAQARLWCWPQTVFLGNLLSTLRYWLWRWSR